MVRTKDPDGVKSNLIISEVQKRACLFDTNHPNYGDRVEKARCWEEVYQCVVPGWSMLGLPEKFAAGKDVQKRWRSIRDSYTKSYRQGKCVAPEMCTPDSKRYQHHKRMAFLLAALKHKKPRCSQEKFESFSEVSNSSHPPEELQIKTECIDKPLDLKTKPDIPEKPETMEKSTETEAETIKQNQTSEIKMDASAILPDDHFDDDKLFMTSLLPFMKKMNDDTRLLCRIEMLKIIRLALQGKKNFETEKMTEDSFNRFSIIAKEETSDVNNGTTKSSDSKLSMVTRSADGTRTIRKRKDRSPSPIPAVTKKRGPGRPRKIRLPQSDSEEENRLKRRPKLRVPPIEPRLFELDESLNTATSVANLTTPQFMRIYNLTRTKGSATPPLLTTVKSEPADLEQPT